MLVVLLCETRAWELTGEKLSANLLDPLHAHLALCVGDREAPNPLYERARYVWRLAERDDWGELYERTAGSSGWRQLLRIHEHFLGGVQDAEHPQIGSGGIVLYFREFLRRSLEGAGVSDSYDWLVVTRSDFMWPIPHPDVRYLSRRHIYVLGGEDYQGVCDRHFVVPRRLVAPFLRVTDPIFSDPDGLKRRIERAMTAQGWTYMNPERYTALRLDELGLWRQLRWLPYAPFLVRAGSDSTRFSEGTFDEELGLFVKYPAELERSRVTREFIRDQEAWKRYLSPIRGFGLRRGLARAIRAAGFDERPEETREVDRAFPRRHPVHLRAYRWVEREVLPAANRIRRGAVPFIGRQLRNLPGSTRLLDARLNRIRRRARHRSESIQSTRSTRDVDDGG